MEDFSTEHRRTLREEIHKPNAYRPRIQTFDDRKLLDTFIKMLPNGGKVLDYGCSEGVIAEYFFQKGLQLTCTDIAQSALDMTKQKITSPLLETLQTNSPHDL
ncbi:MAG: methyltransferase [Candidatus Peribacteria bacterium]|jgi:2-polyprenyl-3-methyl-5-hydroxy-6-metoxy-1,4-benzoquinol methylase|nr:methyltransferase [Candidatus Peribacteria bacterium]